MIKTVSLETALALAEAGFLEDGIHFFWGRRKNPFGGHYKHDLFSSTEPGLIECVAAPTSDEILEELPYRIAALKPQQYILELVIHKHSGDFTVGYRGEPFTRNKWITSESLPEALASMWLWLHKEKLV